MKKILMFLTLAALAAAANSARATEVEINVVPRPNEITINEGVFSVAGAMVSFDKKAADPRMESHLKDFAEHLGLVTGKESVLREKPAKKGFIFEVDPSLSSEAYTLVVEKKSVRVKAADFNGMLYGLQTIKQLLPVEFFDNKPAADVNWSINCLEIVDKPRFGYRGAHLDICRHFFDMTQVKKYLDVMVLHKQNRFHWHLNDDQGWRIEIKKYPLLTEIGSYRDGTCIRKDWESNDGIPHGGFFTQEEIKEVVNYAHNLGIVVIPEIDLPGHMLAALAAYPELGCTGGPYKVWRRWGVSPDVLCPGKDEVFTFIEDILTEVMELFPSEYIHIGGDECPKKRWEVCPDCQKRIAELGLKDSEGHTAEQYLQNYVTSRVQDFLNAHGRKIIGWDEILEGNLAKGATVMSWRGVKGGVKAAKAGYDVIMTPNTYMYLDYTQSKDPREPAGIGHYLFIDKVYSYDPLAELPAETHAHILGVQGNLWTEHIKTVEHLEYMLLPRLDAVSEVQWCQPENKDYERFQKSVARMMVVYDKLDYNYSRTIFGDPGLKE